MADSRRNGSRGRAGGAGGNGRSRTAASKSKGGGSGKGRRAKAARAAGLLRRALTWAAVAGVWCEIGRATSELQSLMRLSYAFFCSKKKRHTVRTEEIQH